MSSDGPSLSLNSLAQDLQELEIEPSLPSLKTTTDPTPFHDLRHINFDGRRQINLEADDRVVKEEMIIEQEGDRDLVGNDDSKSFRTGATGYRSVAPRSPRHSVAQTGNFPQPCSDWSLQPAWRDFTTHDNDDNDSNDLGRYRSLNRQDKPTKTSVNLPETISHFATMQPDGLFASPNRLYSERRVLEQKRQYLTGETVVHTLELERKSIPHPTPGYFDRPDLIRRWILILVSSAMITVSLRRIYSDINQNLLKQSEERQIKVAEAQRRWELNHCDKNPIDLYDRCTDLDRLRRVSVDDSTWLESVFLLVGQSVEKLLQRMTWKHAFGLLALTIFISSMCKVIFALRRWIGGVDNCSSCSTHKNQCNHS